MHKVLAERDPETAARLMPGDGQRIVRALEVLKATGKSISVFQSATGPAMIDPDRAEKIVVLPDRAVLAAASLWLLYRYYRERDQLFWMLTSSGVLLITSWLVRVSCTNRVPGAMSRCSSKASSTPWGRGPGARSVRGRGGRRVAARSCQVWVRAARQARWSGLGMSVRVMRALRGWEKWVVGIHGQEG